MGGTDDKWTISDTIKRLWLNMNRVLNQSRADTLEKETLIFGKVQTVDGPPQAPRLSFKRKWMGHFMEFVPRFQEASSTTLNINDQNHSRSSPPYFSSEMEKDRRTPSRRVKLLTEGQFWN